MDDDEQAKAYAMADFAEPHNNFVRLFGEVFPGLPVTGYVLDIGCGPGDVLQRFARAYPDCTIHGVDGSETMLHYGEKMLSAMPDLAGRVRLIHGMLPGAVLPRERYDVIISNSILHHLHNPQVLWEAVKRHAAAGAPVFIMDLMRPRSQEEARFLVETYARDEPEILKRDFFNSLCAAFTTDEVREQLRAPDLSHLSVQPVSDRHMIIYGTMPR